LFSVLSGVAVLLMVVFATVNFKTGQLRAGITSMVAAIVVSVVFFLLRNSTAAVYTVVIVSAVAAAALFVFRYPAEKHNTGADGIARLDERDISFSRYRLVPGTDDYIDYYQRNPGRENTDARTRALPGLLSKNSRYYHRLNSAVADASFYLLQHLKGAVDGPVTERTQEGKPPFLTGYLRRLMKLHGVKCYGITTVKPTHYYSHAGRAAGGYGREIQAEHSHAIVICSEMKPGFTSTAPLSPEVIETGLRYAESGVWAVQTAAFIRNLGYSARAHIDGDYQVVAPLLALDAGLGGFGWSSVFLTRKYGPRVRFSVVTTNMELQVSEEKPSTDFLSFCRGCRKCAANCPSRAINPDRLERLNADRCFMYWNAVGTDCGKCLAVCPMGHPWGLLKSLALRYRLAGWLLKGLDDVFYG
jgi:ferredoxin